MANRTITETIPKTLLDKLFKIQDFMDNHTEGMKEGVYTEFCAMMVGQGGDPGIYGSFKEIITQLRQISDETKYVRKQKLRASQRKKMITREEAIKRALDPADETYVSCPACSRVMAKKNLAHHRETTIVCKEVWLGRDSTILNPVRDGEKHLQYIADGFDTNYNENDEEGA